MNARTSKKSLFVLAGLVTLASSWQETTAISMPQFITRASDAVYNVIKEHPVIFACVLASPIVYIYMKQAKPDFKARYVEADGVKKLVYYIDDELIGQLPQSSVMMVTEDGKIEQTPKIQATGLLGKAITSLKPLKKAAGTLVSLCFLYALANVAPSTDPKNPKTLFEVAQPALTNFAKS